MSVSLMSRGVIKSLFTVTLILSSGAAVASLQYPIISKDLQKTTERQYLRQEKLQANNLNIIDSSPSFGFDNLIADWMYLQFIQYFGDTDARKVTGYQLISDYFQEIVERDPRFEGAYMKLSTTNTIFAGKPKLTVELLRESLEHLPPTSERGYQLWVYKATDELLYLNDLQAAKFSYQQAVEWAKQSNDPRSDAIVNYAQRMLQFVESNPNTREGRIGAWTIILTTTGQETVQKRVIEEIEKLGGEVVTTPDGRIRQVRVKPQNP